MELNRIYCGDALEVLKSFPSESVNCCITSPPYYGLRDYGVDGQIGLEQTPQQYINRLADIFDEVKRVLKKDGTLWLNIGDSYAGSGKGAAVDPENAKKWKQGTNVGTIAPNTAKIRTPMNIKPKDMIGIPWMLAFELRNRGWYLRQDIIWAKKNPMPESVKDRCTKSHEYVFLLSKSNKYYFDYENIKEQSSSRTNKRVINGDLQRYGGKKYTENPDKFYRTKSGNAYVYRQKRNKRDVWFLPTKPYRWAHFATFPEDLVIPCLLAGCQENGIALDPFFGSGTLGVVCIRKNRFFVGIELNSEYIDLAENRLQNVQTDMNL